jgi:hypothetical protein
MVLVAGSCPGVLSAGGCFVLVNFAMVIAATARKATTAHILKRRFFCFCAYFSTFTPQLAQ